MNYKSTVSKYATPLSIIFLALVIVTSLGVTGYFVNKKANFAIEKMDDAIERYFDERAKNVKAAKEAVPLKEPTIAELEAGAELLGNPDAPVLITVFEDFQCPWCQKVQSVLEQVREAYPTQVKIAFRHFPLKSIHRNAENASIAAICAGRQEKFWEYHDILFEKQGDAAGWSKERDKEKSAELLKQFASDLGLDTASFNNCFGNKETSVELERDISYGSSIGIRGTPTVFVNTEKSKVDFKVLKEAIDKVLE
ncbi:MAG: hypothetical protein CL943_00320 [Candidatus Diapherotrites archaeon]|uniref:Thioredoxin domain-containing protein n=1 Tax=Candidatus Iainarchaeum sp. TaxID=3101447 RepID=A0A2D6LZX9_9ARCH|nr:hypothetical protein [Candidatus Diapherotrites archaeon]|tara:strand:+ start:6262 stop:7020 length:759 start_codon:yes stop_codon:yes gene_type:complete